MMQAESDGFAAIAAMLDPELSVASLHGALVGGLCADTGARLSASALGACLDLVLDEQDLKVSGVLDAVRVTEEALRDPEFGFTPLLPDDDTSLAARVRALAEWCEAFVDGFSAMNSGAALSAETSEILADLGSIAGGLDEESLAEGDDEDENDFMQIAEFVRIAALGIFTERAAPVEATLH
ncbi:MAG: UPF0149 family protein [Gammaproteobacteria bacterium]|nr:UPF0149 family protein [Gammaproteobacteria bacterium]